MSDRRSALVKIVPGDIFHAEYPNGASCICLTTTVTAKVIRARRVTTQDDLEFHRDTGVEHGSSEVFSMIDSIEPLPADIREIILALDRKYRSSSDTYALTEDEKRALKFIARFYPAHPL